MTQRKKTKIEIEDTKNYLANYRIYKNKIEKLENELKKIDLELILIEGSYKENKDFKKYTNNKLIITGKKNILEKEILRWEMIVIDIEIILSQIEAIERDIVFDYVINGINYKKIAEKYNYSETSIHTKINRIINKIELF